MSTAPSPLRICPTCQGAFPAREGASDHASDVCPVDGRALVSVRDAEAAWLGRVIDGKVRIDGVLGRGGVGVVYRGTQLSMNRAVAVKVLRRALSEDAVAVRRFLQEAQAASRLQHPNAITVFDFGQSSDGDLYLVMERLEGRTLAEVIADDGPQAPARAVALVGAACDALHAAHELGLIHRDIKPHNLFVARTAGGGEVLKVLDFGLAKVAGGGGVESITRSGTLCGTPAYMSPEQALDGELDRRSDVYALGVVLYEALTGTLPIAGDTPLQVLMGHVHAAPRPFVLAAMGGRGAVPDALGRVVMRCLSKRPADRPASANALRAELVAALAAVPVAGAAEARRAALERPTIGGDDGTIAATGADVPAPGEASPQAHDGAREATRTGDSRFASTGRARAEQPSSAARVAIVAMGVVTVAACAWVLWARSSAPGFAPSASAPNAMPAPIAAVIAPPAPLAPAAAAAAPNAMDAPNAMLAAGVAANAPSAPPAPVAAANAPPVAAPTRVHVQSRPSGADVFVDGARVGATPFDVPRPPAGRASHVEVRRHGFANATLTVDSATAESVDLPLRRLPALVTE